MKDESFMTIFIPFLGLTFFFSPTIGEIMWV